MKKYWLFLPLVILFLGIDYWLLRHFNTLVWPYLWPRPGIFILIGFFVFVLWFRELFAGTWLLRIVGLVMVFIGQTYLLHSFEITVQEFSLVALLHLIGVTGSFFVIVINFLNQMTSKSHKQPRCLAASTSREYHRVIAPQTKSCCDTQNCNPRCAGNKRSSNPRQCSR